MNIHHTKLVPINELSEASLLGRDECELIEAAINHYLQHVISQTYELKAEAEWCRRHGRVANKIVFEGAAFHLGSKLQKLRKLSDDITNVTEVHFVRDEDQ